MELKASPLGSTPTLLATNGCPRSASAVAKTKGLEIDCIVNIGSVSPTA